MIDVNRQQIIIVDPFPVLDFISGRVYLRWRTHRRAYRFLLIQAATAELRRRRRLAVRRRTRPIHNQLFLYA